MAYSQNDPRWKNIPLGVNSGFTIGQAGCYITSLCETARKLGHDITPKELDQIMCDRGLYVNGGEVSRDDVLSVIFPDIIYLGSQSWYGTPTNMDFFNDGFTICEIDSSPAGGMQTHFMPVVERQGNDLLVDDSWDGNRKMAGAYTGSYGRGIDNIWKGIKYKATTPVASNGGLMIIENTDNWRARANMSFQMLWGRDMQAGELDPWYGQDFLHLVEALEDQQPAQDHLNDAKTGAWAKKDDWQGQIYTLQAQNAQAQTTIDQLTANVKTLTQQVTDLTNKVTDLGKVATVKDNQIKKLTAQLATQSGDTQLLNGFGKILTQMIVRLGLKG